MGEIRPVKPVKLFVGMLAREESTFEAAIRACRPEFGEEERRSPIWPFNHTEYYASEMGENLLRQFVLFKSLVDPAALPELKLLTNRIEKELAGSLDAPVPRSVNLDPGYVSVSAVVLVTTKNYSHRLYLSHGIYGEVTLHFRQGTFASWPWTYPDYQTRPYVKFFTETRARYIQQLKGEGFGATPVECGET